MSTRNIRVIGDEVLRKVSKPVKDMTFRTRRLIEDMLETMYEADGVGLAAVQVGVLKRIVVIDVGEGPIVLINLARAICHECDHLDGILYVDVKEGELEDVPVMEEEAENVPAE